MSTRRELSALFGEMNRALPACGEQRGAPRLPADWEQQIDSARHVLAGAAADHDAGRIDLNADSS